jgi:hypothetical protein
VNWGHFQAFVWLRWRLLINQMRKGGLANTVLLALLAAGLVMVAIGLFIAFFFIGLLALRSVPPVILLYVWDGLVVAFLFSWAIGLLTDLQRSEVLSLDRFLHLPVSLTGAFIINYLSSLLSITLFLFLPAMLALCLALALARGPAMLLLLPLLAAFMLMITAVTYQFQGWLASLMVNQRRRRTVIVVVTISFILLCQLPNLLNVFQPWKNLGTDEAPAGLKEAEDKLAVAQAAGTITAAQHQEQLNALKAAHRARVDASAQQSLHRLEETARLVNTVVPLGWLPLGAMTAAEGGVVPALVGILGMTLLGLASLWRAYRTTVRLYTGQFTAGKPRATPAVRPAGTRRPSTDLLERRLAWLPEQAAAVALGSFRSLLRAPEAKMLCLGPVILAVIGGGMLLANHVDPPQAVRPLMAFGAMALVLLCVVQLVGNQFGFDRNGFRVFVLSPSPRSEILLGKNLAFAPLVLGLGVALVVLIEVITPMRFDYFLALWPQMLSMYLLYCLLGNVLSILAPMRIAAGTLKPMNTKLVPILFQLVFTMLFPLVQLPLLLPLAVQLSLQALGWGAWLPVCLVLSLAECVGVVFLYRALLGPEGKLLQAREQVILEAVTTKE